MWVDRARPPAPSRSPEGECLRFAGYAALFGVADAGRDTIRRGAFARSLAERREPWPLLWEHRPGQRIGLVERVAEDARGLRVIARVERMGSRAARMLLARAVSGLSFGYRARGYRRTAAGRVLEDVELFEVSLVMRPLQHGARVHWVENRQTGLTPNLVIPAKAGTQSSASRDSLCAGSPRSRG